MTKAGRQFYIVQIGKLDAHLAINAEHLRAVVPLGNNRYHIWLAGDLDIPERVGNRLSMLAGVTPVSTHGWEVGSTQLGEIFE